MTHSESRLPGRPDERASAARSSSAPGGCADPLVGVVLVVAEAAAGALLAIWLMVRGLTRSHEATGGKVSAPPPADPGTDWTPVVVIAVLALLVACVAAELLRSGWYWSGGTQVVVAVALGVTVLATAVQGSGREAPEPAPAPAPTYASPPCRSGGDSDECARSGR
ncbi:DUF6234 family protein [Streptomyces filamentosus]|uniref:DUF6234 family protein n=2 Tax=Streptomyces filamentosus TaxID=67294 RepID=A0ABY4UTB8_STRFL|nr:MULTISPECIES: DUF6234 family protein [Streptomyces]MYR80928.1 hypothetical protein [Streptomyces sp. SID5466]USC47578.1 DUF6234 family protein [Streptomyces filamentosus]